MASVSYKQDTAPRTLVAPEEGRTSALSSLLFPLFSLSQNMEFPPQWPSPALNLPMSWPPFVLVIPFFMTWKLAAPFSHWSLEGAVVRALGQAGQ